MINTYDFTVARPEYFKQLSVKDLLFLFYSCPQDEPKLDFYIHYNEIAFTLSGNKILNHRNRSWLLTEIHLLFFENLHIPRNCFIHRDGKSWPFTSLMIFYNRFSRHTSRIYLLRSPGGTHRPDYRNKRERAARVFFYSIVPYFTQLSPPSETLLELKFNELIFLILSDPPIRLLSYVNSISERSKTPLQEIMEPNYTFNLSLSEYARMAQRSLASFKREFIEIYHTTPGKWLTRKRLEYAQMLLDNSSKNVNEIAYESGFENATHFSRIFKEKFGLPPLQYRKQNSNTSNAVA